MALGPTWAKGECADTFTPIGPWLVTADGAGDPGSLSLGLWVNGDQRQSGSTSLMAHGVGELLAHVSSLMTLEPGDLLLTGTPAGVAAGRPEPKPFLVPATSSRPRWPDWAASGPRSSPGPGHEHISGVKATPSMTASLGSTDQIPLEEVSG